MLRDDCHIDYGDACVAVTDWARFHIALGVGGIALILWLRFRKP